MKQKLQIVYKVTTRSAESCLMCYDEKTPTEIKNFLGLHYSTSTWTLPNINLSDSGCFVFMDLASVREFYTANFRVASNFICWEAYGINVKPKTSRVILGKKITIERLKQFWSDQWVLSGWKKVNNFYTADAVKLIRIVDVPA